MSITVNLYEKDKLVLTFDTERVPLKKETIAVNGSKYYKVLGDPINTIMSSGNISVLMSVELGVELLVTIPEPKSKIDI